MPKGTSKTNKARTLDMRAYRPASGGVFTTMAYRDRSVHPDHFQPINPDTARVMFGDREIARRQSAANRELALREGPRQPTRKKKPKPRS